MGRGRWGLVPPKKKVYNGKWYNTPFPGGAAPTTPEGGDGEGGTLLS